MRVPVLTFNMYNTGVSVRKNELSFNSKFIISKMEIETHSHPKEPEVLSLPFQRPDKSQYEMFAGARLSLHALERIDERSVSIKTIHHIKKTSLKEAIVFDDFDHRKSYFHRGRLNYWKGTPRIIVMVNGEERYFVVELHHLEGQTIRKFVKSKRMEGDEQIYVRLSEEEKDPALIAVKARKDFLRKLIVCPVFRILDRLPLVFVVDSSWSNIITVFFHDPNHPHSPPALRNLPLTTQEWSRCVPALPYSWLQPQRCSENISPGDDFDYTKQEKEIHDVSIPRKLFGHSYFLLDKSTEWGYSEPLRRAEYQITNTPLIIPECNFDDSEEIETHRALQQKKIDWDLAYNYLEHFVRFRDWEDRRRKKPSVGSRRAQRKNDFKRQLDHCSLLL